MQKIFQRIWRNKMKKQLGFNIPFSGFSNTCFLNCFTSTYMFIEGKTGNDDYYCQRKDGKSCDGCGGKCRDSSGNIQERLFFLFDTMCGRSALRCRYDNEPTEMQKLIGETGVDGKGTDYTVDFLFGFAGYEYRKLTDCAEFKDAITKSIDVGIPVIAKVKRIENGAGAFRVITGYDGDAIICPEYTGAQNQPKAAPVYEELEVLFVIGDKTQSRYTVKDGLERIINVMEFNISEKLWSNYIDKLLFYGREAFEQADEEERKSRMKRTADTMWHTFNCHNFSGFFGYLRDAENIVGTVNDFSKLRGGDYSKLSGEIDYLFGSTHNVAWGVIASEQNVREHGLKWTSHNAQYLGELAAVALERLAENDKQVLEIIKKMRDCLI
jgi:hypothetical protein